MAPIYRSVGPRVGRAKGSRSSPVRSPPAEGPAMKTSGVGADDLIRVLRPRAVRFYRDRMTVGAFADEVGDLRAALKQLVSSHRAGLIAFEAARRAPK